MFLLFRLLAFIFLILKPANASCGENQRTYSNVEMDNVYGLWFGVGYAQHSPDLTNRPNVIGCVTLYISDVTYEDRQDWLGLDNPVSVNDVGFALARLKLFYKLVRRLRCAIFRWQFVDFRHYYTFT